VISGEWLNLKIKAKANYTPFSKKLPVRGSTAAPQGLNPR